MRFHVFTIEVRDPGPGQDALNAFCAQHRLADVEKRFVDQGLPLVLDVLRGNARR
jgi:hypothetical protein